MSGNIACKVSQKMSTLLIIHEDMINQYDTHFEWLVISHRFWTR